jgi:hypothetical protein
MRHREVKMEFKCDTPGCLEKFEMDGEMVGWVTMNARARHLGWAIREDVVSEDGKRHRREHKHFCPAHRFVSSRR